MQDEEELRRLSEFNNMPPQAQRRWSASRPRSRHNSLGSGTPPFSQSPRSIGDEQIARLSSSFSTTSLDPRTDQLVVDMETVADKVGALGTRHKLLEETVTDLQNRLVSLEKLQGIDGTRTNSNACCILF